MKIQEWGLLAIVVTICVAFLASVLLSAFGMAVAPELQGVISTSFTALVVIVPTWLAVGRGEQAKSAARMDGYRLGVQAKADEYQAAMLKVQQKA